MNIILAEAVVKVASFILPLTLALHYRRESFPLKKKGIVLGVSFGALTIYFGSKLFFVFYHWKHLRYFMAPDGNVGKFVLNLGYGATGYLVGAFISVYAFSKIRKHKLSFLTLMDYVSPFLMLALAIIRIECFAVGCCYGRCTKLPWGVPFLRTAGDSIPRHPTQLYSILFLTLIFVIGLKTYNKAKYKGVTTFLCIFLYGFFRFFNEFLRVDSPVVFYGLTLAQMNMITIMLTGAIGLFFVFKKRIPQ